jgi:hypothetical protein
MTTPLNPEGTPPGITPVETTFEELEALSVEESTPTPTTPADPHAFRFEGAGVPENLRGLSAAELAERATRLEQALQISESARLRSTPSAPAPQPVPSTPVAPPAPTREQLQELYDRDPLEAMAAMTIMAEQRVRQEYQGRMQPMVDSARSSAEQAARARYAEDFELFGDQIKEVVAQVDPQALTNPAAWESLVAYVRGRPENLEKIVEKRIAKARESNGREVAQNVPTNPVADDTAGLDATQLEICKVMQISPRDYRKYM